MSIRIVKLTSGEELIADVTDGATTSLVLKKPAMISLMPSRTDPNQIMVGLLPYAQYARDHTVVVDRSFVVWQETPVDELYNQYNTMFGSGIQLV
jgi:hypothetical protein